MAKTNKETALLFSSVGSAFYYANRKNRRKLKGEKKLALKKYDPLARKHVLFEEKKASKLKKKFKRVSATGTEGAPAKPAKAAKAK